MFEKLGIVLVENMNKRDDTVKTNKHDSIKIVRGDTRLAVKVGAWYFVSTFLVKGITFITTPFFARLMSSEAYGEFSNYANWQAILLIIVSLELHTTMNRAYYDYAEEYDEYSSTMIISSLIISFVFYFLCLVFRQWVFMVVSIPQQYVHVLFFTLLCSSWKCVYWARERTLYRYKIVAALSMIDLVIPTLIALTLVASLPGSQRLSARIYGHYIPSSVLGLVCAGILLKKKRAFRFDLLFYAIKLALPLLVHYLTIYLLTSSSIFITKNLLGASIAAIVSIAASAIHILSVLFEALSGAVTTWMMDNLNQKKENIIRAYIVLYVGLLSFMTAGVILLAPEIIWILGGSRYQDATILIPGMSLGVLISSITSIFTIVLTYDKKVIPTAICTAIAAILSVMAKTLLLKQEGLMVLVYVNIIAFAVLYCVNYWLISKAGRASCVNFKAFAAIIFSVAILALFSPVLFSHTLIRYGILVALIAGAVIICYRKREVVLSLFNRKKQADGGSFIKF